MTATPDLTLATMKMVISLGVVLAIIWGLYRLAKKNLPMAQGNSNGKMMQVLESQYLGVKRTITMVRIPGAILVLGVSPDKVNLLTQIDDPSIIKSIVESAEKDRSILSFKNQLHRLTRPKRTGIPADLNQNGVE